MKDVEDYINNVLDEKRPEFGGKRVCPFAAHELSSNKLMIAELGDKNLIDLFHEFKNSDYDSALFIIKENMPAEETKSFQVFVNKLLEYEGMGEYKNICFNPNDKVAIDGYNPRAQAPYFMVNVATRKALGKAARALKKTNYYDNMRDEYLAFLKVKKVGKK